MKKSWRAKVAKWHRARIGYTEQPPGSNTDHRKYGIRTAQDGCANGTWLRGEPWCGVWVWGGLHFAGLVRKGDSWMASVALIEERAKKGLRPFRGWTTDISKVKTGDVVVLFGHGVHVGTVRGKDKNFVYTWEGNTSPGIHGSQSNGGGAFRRARRHADVHGYALIRGK